MNEITFPLHPASTLVKALVGAIVLATIIFVTLVLPAEYNTDPTGVGKLLGLTVLTPETTEQVNEQTSEQPTEQTPQGDEATIVVPANRGVEYKFQMVKHAQMTYEWVTDGEPLYFDFHGEPKGDTTGYFESYTITTAAEVKGSMTMPFDGIHGWYWKNTSNKTVTVTLKTKGDYKVVGLIH